MIETIYPILGMFAGIIGGKVVAQYVLMIYEQWVEDHTPQIDTDKMRWDFERVCNTVMYELSVKQQRMGIK